MEKQVLILFKGSIDDEREEDEYTRLLKTSEVDFFQIPVLHFEYVEEEIYDFLKSVSTYSHIIVTSSRPLYAIEKFITQSDKLILQQIPFHVVGKATEKICKELLGISTVYGSDSGSADKLISQPEFVKMKGPIAYLCGNLRKSTIVDSLDSLKIQYNEFIVYKTVPNSDVQLPLTINPRICIFFSPSGVVAVEKCLSHEDILVAIGDTTGKAIVNAGFKVHAIANTPSPEGVAAALKSIQTF